MHIPVNSAWTEDDFEKWDLFISLELTYAIEPHGAQTSAWLHKQFRKIYVVEIKNTRFTAGICCYISTDLHSIS